jgi:hypothetical protein
MSTVVSTAVKMDPEAQSLWHEVATASDEVAAIIDRIPGLTVTGIETRNELERAAALLQAVAGILRRTEGLIRFPEGHQRAPLAGDRMMRSFMRPGRVPSTCLRYRARIARRNG